MKNRTEIVMIIATAVVLLLFIIYDKYNEGFQNQNSPRPAVTSCPPSLRGKITAYYDKKDVMCCDGKVTNNMCDSNPICTLGVGTKDIKSCSDFMAEQMNSMSERICPKSLPNFYLDLEKGESGCTDSPLKTNYKGPIRTNANKCNAYFRLNDKGELDLDYFGLTNVNPDGCGVQQKLEVLQKSCIGTHCIPFSRPIPDKNMVLLGLDFTDVDNVRRTCYDQQSYTKYLQSMNPNANINDPPYTGQLCSNAKQLYIDKGK